MEITKLGESILREKAVDLGASEIDDTLRKTIDEMFSLMVSSNGVGLAAPQVGIGKRFFVLIADDDVRRVFINPQIISTSAQLVDYDEGCLSIPGINKTVKRPAVVKVQALNERGKHFMLTAGGLLARIIQHEYDHLDGVLFIDHLGEEKARAITEKFLKKQKKQAKKSKGKLDD